MKTGKTVAKRGLYATECCDKEQIFDSGDNFTRCPTCMKLCDWDLINRVVPWTEFEETDALAA